MQSTRIALICIGGLFCCVAWLGAVPGAESESAVFRVHTTDPTSLTFLRASYDVWGRGHGREQGEDPHVLALLSPQEVVELRARGLRLERDVEETEAMWVVQESLGGSITRGGGTIAGFPCYRTVEQTFADLQALAAANPTIAQWVDIGDSWEMLNGPGAGFDIPVLVLTNQAITGPKPVFLLIAAIHARELTTAELATRFAEHLVAGYGSDPNLTWILDRHEVHIVPQLNPDGRKEAEVGAFWRKNVDNDFCSNTSSRGIDLNRNSTFFFGGGASSGDQCSDLFRGPSAASEPETSTIETYMAQVFPDQRGDDMNDPAPATAEGVFISLHSFSELVLFPWEGTNTDSPNHGQLQTLGRKFGFFNDYSVCQDCLGTASGTTVDAAYGEYGVAGYTFELGTAFFQSCTTFENTIFPDNLPALVYAAKAARRPYQNPAGPDVTAAAVATASVAAGTPVSLTATADDTRYDSNGFGTEPQQPIASVGYTVDDPPWVVAPTPMAPADGTFNGTVEDAVASIDTTGLGAGRHMIWVVGVDDDGNVGVPTTVFLDIVGGNSLFVDGFESGDTSAWSDMTP